MPCGRNEVNLLRMRQLMERLGNPLADTPIIHIAGTKGKGSTAAMCAAMLTAAGYKTGLYTSPHLEQLEERYSIDGDLISSQTLTALCGQLRTVVDELDAEADAASEPRLTFFELTTALAFMHFAQADVDWAVLEVGLGGRLDSTNVCSPRVTAITNISFDHTRQLGNSLEEIAREKAGIIKQGVPVISGVMDKSAATVVADVAAQREAPLRQLGRDFHFDYVPPEHLEQEQETGLVRYRSSGTQSKSANECETPLAMLGTHQAANAAVALAIRDEVLAKGFELPQSAVTQALSKLVYPARIEVVHRQPTVIVDAAHNVASVQALIETLRASFTARRRYLIFASTNDKDVRGILRLVNPFFDRIFLTQFVGNARATPPDELFRNAPGDNDSPTKLNRYELCADPGSAWQAARAAATEEDMICVSGSFFLAGEIRHWIAEHANA